MEEKQLPESSYIENKGIGARVICQEFFEFLNFMLTPLGGICNVNRRPRLKGG